MRSLRLTKTESNFLRARLTPGATTNAIGDLTPRDEKFRTSILAKLDAAELAPPGADVRPLEDALVVHAGGKAARLVGGAYAKASRRAAALGLTVEDVAQVGDWIAGQRWLGGVTLLSVMQKWHEWLPLARRDVRGPRRPGFGEAATDVGQGTEVQRPPDSPGRRPGFRR